MKHLNTLLLAGLLAALLYCAWQLHAIAADVNDTSVHVNMLTDKAYGVP